MTADHLLYVTLLALLPKDGTPVSADVLALTAASTKERVAQVLAQALRTGQVRLDQEADTYAVMRQGDAL